MKSDEEDTITERRKRAEDEDTSNHNISKTESLQLFLYPAELRRRSSTFGLDCRIIDIPADFNGVYGINPGPHLFWFDVEADCRQCFLVWYDQETVFAPTFVNSRFEAVVPIRESNLPAVVSTFSSTSVLKYTYDPHWYELTNCVTQRVIERVMPGNMAVRSDLNVFSMNKEYACAEKCEEMGLTNIDLCQWAMDNGQLMYDQGSQLCFTHIPFLHFVDHTHNKVAVFGNHNDSSLENPLLEMLSRFCGDDTEFIGEFQLSFVLLWFGKNVFAADHWLRMINYFCVLSGNCIRHQSCFVKFLTSWRTQLEFVSPKFFNEFFKTNRFVMEALPVMGQNIRENVCLVSEMTAITELLANKFNFHIPK